MSAVEVSGIHRQNREAGRLRPAGGVSVARIALWWAVGALSGCNSHRDITIDGPYHLVAAGNDEDTSVCYDGPDGCIGRIPATVYAVGADANYVVAARHPEANRDITEYYYVIRSADTPTVDTSAAVRGPLDTEAFDAARTQLHLPALTYELPSLK